jgi:serine/threonine protein kinase
LLQEARVTGQLQHPGIVPVYDLFQGEGDRLFYTMRLVEGRTLRDAIGEFHTRRREARRREQAADRLALIALINAFVGVCNAIAYAHARGVIHRELKGGNVLLGEFGEVVVLLSRHRDLLAVSWKQLANLHREAKRPAPAIDALLKCKEIWTGVPIRLFETACDFAQVLPLLEDPAAAPERDRCTGLVLQSLDASIAHGFHDAKLFQTHAALAPLHSHPQWQSLLQRMATR